MTLYIVRHGLTEENNQQILQGHLPGILTETGKEQMRKAADRLVEIDVEYDCLISSDLRRALDSAEIIANRLNMSVSPNKLLRERDWGTYTGISVSEAREKYYKDGMWNFPLTEHPVETEEQLAARAHKALNELKEQHPNENIIIVTHGLFARFLIAAQCNCDFREVTPLVNAEVRVLGC